VPVLAVLATLVLAVSFFFKAFRQGHLTWALPARVGVLVLALKAIEKINTLPLFYRSYDTSQALSTFTITSLISLILGVVIYGLMAVVVVSLTMSLLRSLYPAEMPIRGWVGLMRFPKGSAQLWGHSLLLGAALFFVGRGVGRLSLFVRYNWMTEYLKPGSYSPPGLNTYLPFLVGPSEFGQGLVVIFAVMAIVLVWLRVTKRKLSLVLPIAAIAALLQPVSSAESMGHYLALTGMSLISVGAILFTVIRLSRFNLLAYGFLIWLMFFFSRGIQILSVSQGMLSYQVQGALLVLFGLFPLVFARIAHLKVGDTPPGSG
jgi:hypothetical protein